MEWRRKCNWSRSGQGEPIPDNLGLARFGLGGRLLELHEVTRRAAVCARMLELDELAEWFERVNYRCGEEIDQLNADALDRVSTTDALTSANSAAVT